MSQKSSQQRLEAAYDAYAHRVYAYAVRHCGAGDADDVVSEVFAIAWSRIDVLPPEPLPWLLVTAGNVIKNRRRADARSVAMTTRLGEATATNAPGADELVAERRHLFEALERLSDLEREALLLVAWDGLDAVGASEVARCSPRAFRARLSRARARLTSELESSDAGFVATTREASR